jgi:hypothetical protein
MRAGARKLSKQIRRTVVGHQKRKNVEASANLKRIWDVDVNSLYSTAGDARENTTHHIRPARDTHARVSPILPFEWRAYALGAALAFVLGRT